MQPMDKAGWTVLFVNIALSWHRKHKSGCEAKRPFSMPFELSWGAVSAFLVLSAEWQKLQPFSRALCVFPFVSREWHMRQSIPREKASVLIKRDRLQAKTIIEYTARAFE